MSKNNTESQQEPNVFVNGHPAIYLNSGGILHTKDVCLTGTFRRPVTYHNVAESKDADNTASTVFINGNPACTIGSIFSRSRGDEGGDHKGKSSSTIKEKAEFLQGSPNVSIEGQSAVAEGHLMHSNNANTSVAPVQQPGSYASPPSKSGSTVREKSEPNYLFWVDVIGQQPLAQPDVLIYRIDVDDEHAVAMAAGSGEQDDESARCVLGSDDDTKRELLLRLVDQRGLTQGVYDIPLAHELQPYERTTSAPVAKQADVVLVPMEFQRYTTAEPTAEQTGLLRSGWLYVFIDGYLWREVAVVDQALLSDVNLAWYHGRDVREATTVPQPALLLPVLIKGKAPKIHIAYSETQWSWAQIAAMGGMQADDLRLKFENKTPHQLSGEQQFALSIDERMQCLDLAPCLDAKALPQITPATNDANQVDLALPLGVLLPIGYLYDPIGVAWSLKETQVIASESLQLLAETMGCNEYALGRVIKDILTVESQHDQAKKEAGKPKYFVLESLDATGFDPILDKGAYFNRKKIEVPRKTIASELSKHPDIQEEGDVDIIVDMETGSVVRHERPLDSKLGKLVDQKRLKSTLDDWDDKDKQFSQFYQEACKALVDWITQSAEQYQPNQFQTALQDYFANTTKRFIVGLAHWSILKSNVHTETMRDYLKQVADGKNSLGRALADDLSEQRQAALEIVAQGPTHVANFSDTTPEALRENREVIETLEASGDLVFDLITSLAEVKMPEGPSGVRWLAERINLWVPSLQVSVRDMTVGELQAMTTLMDAAPQYYRYLPSELPSLLQVKVEMLAIQGTDVPNAMANIQRSKWFNKGFVGVLGALHLINASYAIRQLVASQGKDFKSWLLVGQLGSGSINFLLEALELNLTPVLAKSELGLVQAEQRVKVLGGMLEKGTMKNSAGRIMYREALSSSAELTGKVTKLTSYLNTIEIASPIFSLGFVFFSLALDGLDVKQELEYGTRRSQLMAEGKLVGHTISGIAASNLFFNAARETYQVVRVIALGTEAAGAATTSTGVGVVPGLILMVVGEGIALLCDHWLETERRPLLEKALQYGYFGTDSTSIIHSQFDKPKQHDKQLVAAGDTIDTIAINAIDLSDQLGRIYHALFDYHAELSLFEAERVGDAHVSHPCLLQADISFSRLLPEKSRLSAQLEVYNDKGQLVQKFDMSELRYSELNKDGNLVSVRLLAQVTSDQLFTAAYNIQYWPSNPSMLQRPRVVVKTQLDIEGDGRYTIPEQKEYRVTSSQKWDSLSIAEIERRWSIAKPWKVGL